MLSNLMIFCLKKYRRHNSIFNAVNMARMQVLRYPCTVLCFVISLFAFLSIVTRPGQKQTSLIILKDKESLDQTAIRLDVGYVEENLNHLDQEDPQLIQYVRARHLMPPSKLPCKLKRNGYYKDETLAWVQKFFGDKRDGVFIEVGAADGEFISHTLYLERELGWTGLLIECNPTHFSRLRSIHRNAWVSNACLSVTSKAGIQTFVYPARMDGWLVGIGTLKRLPNFEKKRESMLKKNYPKAWINVDVDTVPLYTLLAALDWKEIDYFSFDIEGSELAVLRTFPFEKVIFKVLVIESQFYNKTEIAELNNLLKPHGYHYIKTLGINVDSIYVHDSMKHLV